MMLVMWCLPDECVEEPPSDPRQAALTSLRVDQAARALREGMWVRRLAWPEGAFLELSVTRKEIRTIYVAHSVWRPADMWCPPIEDLVARDWQAYHKDGL